MKSLQAIAHRRSRLHTAQSEGNIVWTRVTFLLLGKHLS